ncbi:hypothetical protein BH09BAC6_BH09BAC6_02870 [soil metagenome]
MILLLITFLCKRFGFVTKLQKLTVKNPVTGSLALQPVKREVNAVESALIERGH